MRSDQQHFSLWRHFTNIYRHCIVGTAFYKGIIFRYLFNDALCSLDHRLFDKHLFALLNKLFTGTKIGQALILGGSSGIHIGPYYACLPIAVQVSTAKLPVFGEANRLKAIPDQKLIFGGQQLIPVIFDFPLQDGVLFDCPLLDLFAGFVEEYDFDPEEAIGYFDGIVVLFFHVVFGDLKVAFLLA